MTSRSRPQPLLVMSFPGLESEKMKMNLDLIPHFRKKVILVFFFLKRVKNWPKLVVSRQRGCNTEMHLKNLVTNLILLNFLVFF